MKITKSQLKQIIKEELSNLLQESEQDPLVTFWSIRGEKGALDAKVADHPAAKDMMSFYDAVVTYVDSIQNIDNPGRGGLEPEGSRLANMGGSYSMPQDPIMKGVAPELAEQYQNLVDAFRRLGYGEGAPYANAISEKASEAAADWGQNLMKSMPNWGRKEEIEPAREYLKSWVESKQYGRIKEELTKLLSEDYTYHTMSPCEEQATRDSYGRLEHELDVKPWRHWTEEQRALFPRGYTWSRADRNKCRAEMRKPEDRRYFSPSDIFQAAYAERRKRQISEIRASGLGTFGAEYPDLASDLGPGEKTEREDAERRYGGVVAQMATLIQTELRELYEDAPEEKKMQFIKTVLENVLVLYNQIVSEYAEKHHLNIDFEDRSVANVGA